MKKAKAEKERLKRVVYRVRLRLIGDKPVSLNTNYFSFIGMWVWVGFLYAASFIALLTPGAKVVPGMVGAVGATIMSIMLWQGYKEMGYHDAIYKAYLEDREKIIANLKKTIEAKAEEDK